MVAGPSLPPRGNWVLAINRGRPATRSHTDLDFGSISQHKSGVRAASTSQEPFSARIMATYALAAAGGVIGYMPLLTLLLPLKLDALAATDRYGVLAACGVVGALIAGFANVAFGWLGDRSVAQGGGRRGWLLGGMVATIASFAGVVVAHTALAIVGAIVIFQIAINAVLAQVGALTAEEVPTEQKATVASLLTLGTPLAAGASALVVAVAASEAARLAIVAVLMTICLLPLAVARRRPAAVTERSAPARSAMRRDLVIAWTARLLMQIAGNGVGFFLLFYFRDMPGDASHVPATLAQLLFVATLAPVPLALLLGRWSDRVGRQTPFLAGAAALATAGLVGMAWAQSWLTGAISYIAVASGVTVFAALNIGHAMLLLPDNARRGRDLGILNLANTAPQVVASLLAWGSITAHGFGTGLTMLAVLTLLAGLLPLALSGGPRR